MISDKYLYKRHGAIKTLLTTFYSLNEQNDFCLSYELLSPNLKRMFRSEHIAKKYSRVFLFELNVQDFTIFKLVKMKEGLFEAVVMLTFIPDDENSNDELNNNRVSHVNARAIKLQVIEFENELFIDDIFPYKEFWQKEFLEYLGTELN